MEHLSRTIMSKEPTATTLNFDEIVEKHGDFVYNVALRMTSDHHEAEDVMQDALLSAFRAFPKFQGKSSITTWLYRITVNAALMKHRKEKNAKYLTETGVEDMDVPNWADNPEKAALDSELRDAIQDGLSQLPPDLRMAVILRDVQGLSGAEAAEALNAPPPCDAEDQAPSRAYSPPQTSGDVHEKPVVSALGGNLVV